MNNNYQSPGSIEIVGYSQVETCWILLAERRQANYCAAYLGLCIYM